jgi:hypothetical protein
MIKNKLMIFSLWSELKKKKKVYVIKDDKIENTKKNKQEEMINIHCITLKYLKRMCLHEWQIHLL